LQPVVSGAPKKVFGDYLVCIQQQLFTLVGPLKIPRTGKFVLDERVIQKER